MGEKTPIEMASDIRTFQKNMGTNIRIAIYSEAQVLLNDFRDRSPVDTGLYRKSWIVSRNRFVSGDDFAGVTIMNSTPYAYYMEFGAPEGGAPWFYPNPQRKRTGKLVRRNGRVWAGGLNPGHSQTVGGAIGPVLAENEPRLKALSNIIANSIIQGLP